MFALHPSIYDRDNAVPFRDVGSPGGLKVGQRLGKVRGRAAGETGELLTRPAQLARAVELVHCAEQINPDAAGCGRTQRQLWVF